MSADTPAEYAQVRTQRLEARNMADEIGARDQAFKAATIAADCSFSAAEASDAKSRQDLPPRPPRRARSARPPRPRAPRHAAARHCARVAALTETPGSRVGPSIDGRGSRTQAVVPNSASSIPCYRAGTYSAAVAHARTLARVFGLGADSTRLGPATTAARSPTSIADSVTAPRPPNRQFFASSYLGLRS